MQESVDPNIAWTDVGALCVEPIEYQASDRHSAEAQDVGHPHDVLAEPCHVCLRVRAKSSCHAAVRNVRVDPVEHPGAQARDLGQAPLHAPSPFCPPLVHNVQEPVAHDGVDVDLAALRTTAAGLVFTECSGQGDRGGWSAGVGDLLVSERSGDGVSWLPPARPL